MIRSGEPLDRVGAADGSRPACSPRHARQTKKLTLDLKPGHYAIICNLPGHYLGGMYTDLTVK